MAYRPGAKDFFSQNIFTDDRNAPRSLPDIGIENADALHNCADDSSYRSLIDMLLDDNASTHSGASWLSLTAFEENNEIYSQDSDDVSKESLDESYEDDENCTVFSHLTSTTSSSNESDTATILGDKLPKSFLQLTGISG